MRSVSGEVAVGSWGFIGLAYGVAAVAIGTFFVLLRRRLRGAAEELSALERDGSRRTP
jgi:hypothetical protein